MEGAGICEDLPCIAVRGVCDYADSHKDKKWQKYAAATAVSASKAVLEQYPKAHNARAVTSQRNWVVPFGRNTAFVGHGSILDNLVERISPDYNNMRCPHIAIIGL
jgi:hypothetical protein